MSKQVELTVTPRAEHGKGAARRVRREGRVPAIAYGAGLEPTMLSVDALELYHALHTGAGENAVLRLAFDGDMHLAMAREIQLHPVRREILHVDFVTVSRDVKVTVDVPIVLEGDAPGAEEGAIVEQQLHALPVEVLPLEVPDQLTLDISGMEVGHVKRVGDVRLPEGVTALEDPDATVVTLTVPQLEVPEPEAEAPLEGLEGAEAAVEEAAESPEEARQATSGGTDSDQE
jgi:large subunit ribosomal protein L25